MNQKDEAEVLSGPGEWPVDRQLLADMGVDNFLLALGRSVEPIPQRLHFLGFRSADHEKSTSQAQKSCDEATLPGRSRHVPFPRRLDGRLPH
jgi:hypothetical protein